MKKNIGIFLIIILMFFTGCSNASKIKLPDGLEKVVSVVMNEMNVIDYKIISYDVIHETAGVTSSNIGINIDDRKFYLSAFCTEEKWYCVSMMDVNKKCYWADTDVRKYVDIYDWKTGKLISTKQEELPSLE